MPRIRSLKPEALQHRHVGRLSDRAFRLWVGGITRSDDEGRFLVDLGELRLLIFGYQDGVSTTDVGRALDEIASLGLLRLYVSDGMLLAEFPSWRDHQKIDRPRHSKLPSPQEGTVVPSLAEAERLVREHSSSGRRTVADVSPSVRETPPGIGSDREGIGSEPPHSPPQGADPLDNGLGEAAKEVIGCLNETLGTNYRVTTRSSIRHISARLHEGFTMEDFKAVIAAQVKEWGRDPKMAKYLRPETLFGPKFEGYLQNAKATPPAPDEPTPGPAWPVQGRR